MIKLIFCDIDGTLLEYGETTIDPEIIKIIKKLIEKGIMFVPTSGRQLSSLLTLFAEVQQNLYYICENGAILFKANGEIINKTVIEKSLALKLCHCILNTSGCEILISGANTSYIIPKDPQYPSTLQAFTGNTIKIIDSPEEVDEDIIKISANCPDGIERLTQVQEDLKVEFGSCLNMAIAGSYWLDFTLSDKGMAADSLCRTLGIDDKDTMAFGDSFNDLPLLKKVGFPFLMSNAPDELKRMGFCQSESVLVTLKEFLL